MTVPLFPRPTGASSSTKPVPVANKYWFYVPAGDYAFKVEGISTTMPGGTETFCVTGPLKSVGQELAVRIYSKSTNALVLVALVPLRSDLTTSTLGSGGGKIFKAHARFLANEPAVCSIAWSEPHNLWDIKIWAE